jgi:hypothetical protein
LRESIAAGSTYAQGLMRKRHPEFFKTADPEDAEVREDAKRVTKFYKQLMATAREDFS